MVETTAANPELLQEQVAQLLVQPLEAASVVLSSGVRIFDTASPLRIPKLTSGATVGFVGEGQLIPEGNVDFGEVTLMPSDRKSIKTLIRFTNELLRQSVIGLDATLKARLVTDVSNKLDTALLTGAGANASAVQTVTISGTPTGGTFTLTFNEQTTSGIAYNAAAATVQTALQGLSTIGSGNATVTGSAGGPYTVTFAAALANTSVAQIVPSGSGLTGGTSPTVTVAYTTRGETGGGITGIINQVGVQTGDLDVADADSLLDAIALASAAEVTPTRWFISGADFIALRKLKDAQERYLLESDVTKDVTYRLFGIPVTVTNKLATGKAVLADTAQIAVARDLAPSVTL